MVIILTLWSNYGHYSQIIDIMVKFRSPGRSGQPGSSQGQGGGGQHLGLQPKVVQTSKEIIRKRTSMTSKLVAWLSPRELPILAGKIFNFLIVFRFLFDCRSSYHVQKILFACFLDRKTMRYPS